MAFAEIRSGGKERALKMDSMPNASISLDLYAATAMRLRVNVVAFFSWRSEMNAGGVATFDPKRSSCQRALTNRRRPTISPRLTSIGIANSMRLTFVKLVSHLRPSQGETLLSAR